MRQLLEQYYSERTFFHTPKSFKVISAPEMIKIKEKHKSTCCTENISEFGILKSGTEKLVPNTIDKTKYTLWEVKVVYLIYSQDCQVVENHIVQKTCLGIIIHRDIDKMKTIRDRDRKHVQ